MSANMPQGSVRMCDIHSLLLQRPKTYRDKYKPAVLCLYDPTLVKNLRAQLLNYLLEAQKKMQHSCLDSKQLALLQDASSSSFLSALAASLTSAEQLYW